MMNHVGTYGAPSYNCKLFYPIPSSSDGSPPMPQDPQPHVISATNIISYALFTKQSTKL